MDVNVTLAREQGYLFVPQCVERTLLVPLRAEVLEVCERRGWMPPRLGGFAYDSPEYCQLQGEVQPLPEFTALRDSPAVGSQIGQLLGAEFRARQGDVCRVVFPGARAFATRAHQDQFFLKRPEEIWSLWIPLGDCPRSMGPLAVWPGSQRLGLLPHDPVSGCEAAAQAAGAAWVSFDFECGDALLVHKLTAHRALDNVSREIRVSVDFRFARNEASSHSTGGPS